MVCSRYPKECRYYETVLKRKCLRKLRNNVWEKKTRWKLVKKADSHYRLKLLYKYMKWWMIYMTESFKKRIYGRLAESHYEEKLKARGISAFRKNLEHNWMFFRICHKKTEWSLKFKIWHRWKHYVEKRVKVREIKLLANKIRQERLRIRFFYVWLYRFKEKQSLSVAYEKATQKHNQNITKKYFNYWKIYIDSKKCKKEIERVSIVCYQDKLKENVFHLWRKHTMKKSLYRNQIKIIRTFYQNYLLKTYIGNWHSVYCEWKKHKKICNWNNAVNFSNRKLTEKTFRLLFNFRDAKKVIKEKTELFGVRYRVVYVEFYVKLWRKRLTEKLIMNNLIGKADEWRKSYLVELFLAHVTDKYRERKEEKQRIVNVVRYSNAIITHRAFKGWQHWIVRKVNKKAKWETALSFYFQTIVKKSFERWKIFKFMKFQKKTAIAYCTNVALSKAFAQWKLLIEEKKSKEEKTKNFERKRNFKLATKIFDVWKKELGEIHTKTNLAVTFHNNRTLFKAFLVWRRNVQTKIKNKCRYDRYKIILNNLIISEAISRWYEIHLHKQTLQRKFKEITKKRDKRSMIMYFNVWRNFVEKMKNVRQGVDWFPQLRSTVLLEQYIGKMVQSLNERKGFRRKEELANRTKEKLLKRKYLRKWVSFICWKREKIFGCLSQENKFEDFTKMLEFSISSEKNVRRKPIIPDYLREEFNFDEIEDVKMKNEETFRVISPINKRLPVVGQKGVFMHFEN